MLPTQSDPPITTGPPKLACRFIPTEPPRPPLIHGPRLLSNESVVRRALMSESSQEQSAKRNTRSASDDPQTSPSTTGPSQIPPPGFASRPTGTPPSSSLTGKIAATSICVHPASKTNSDLTAALATCPAQLLETPPPDAPPACAPERTARASDRPGCDERGSGSTGSPRPAARSSSPPSRAAPARRADPADDPAAATPRPPAPRTPIRCAGSAPRPRDRPPRPLATSTRAAAHWPSPRGPPRAFSSSASDVPEAEALRPSPAEPSRSREAEAARSAPRATPRRSPQQRSQAPTNRSPHLRQPARCVAFFSRTPDRATTRSASPKHPERAGAPDRDDRPASCDLLLGSHVAPQLLHRQSNAALRGIERDAYRFGDLRHAHPHGVVQHDRDPLIVRKRVESLDRFAPLQKGGALFRRDRIEIVQRRAVLSLSSIALEVSEGLAHGHPIDP